MNGQEIIDKLNELEISGWDFADDFETEENEAIFGNSTVVDEEGGYEGGGEYVHRVRHFTDHNVFIKLEGFYSSYNGTDWDGYDYEEVKPVERTVTFYE